MLISSHYKLSGVALLMLGMVSAVGCRQATPARAALPKGTTALFAADDIPHTAEGERVRYGREIFDHTPQLASAYVGGTISCNDCHIQSGTAAYAAPMVNLAQMFPMFNKRAGHTITLEDRIEECFTRSENGHPLPYDSKEMVAVASYIRWLSRDEVKGKPWKGRGFVKTAALEGNPHAGAMVYTSQCAACHGANGEGVAPILPAVWGAASYNDGAGMNDPKKMAAFLLHNMPQNHPGSLSPEQAFDVAEYVHTMPRPKFNEAYKNY